MLFKCLECEYITNLKTNLKRHCIRKHESAEKMDEENVLKVDADVLKVDANVRKVDADVRKVDAEIPKVDDIPLLTENGKIKCTQCNKMLASKITFSRHIKICKGLLNPLECNICHNIFSSKSSKSHHMKLCKNNTPAVIDQSQTAEIINNNTTNNNITNNTNNITNNNIINNIIVYNDQNIEFKDDHITKKDLKRIFNGASVETIQAISQYAIKLLENIDNLCVRKKHLTNSYCEVYAGNGIWQTRPDQAVFERFSQDVAISANDKLYEHPNIGTDKVRNEITELVSEPDDVHSQSIKLRRELRSIVLHKTKQEQPIEI